MKKITLFIASLFLVLTINGQDTSNVLGGVTVIGVRADSKTPVSQKTINRSSIDSTYQGEEMPILMDKTPSITSQSDGGHSQGYTTFRLRGIDQTRVNMTLNGVPLNEPEDQGVYTSNYPNFMNNIKSFQIQRGVGTSSNGVASYAGSINFESESGVTKGNEIQFGYGSFGTERVMGTVSTGVLENNTSMFASISHYRTNGYKYHSGGSGYSFYMGGGYYGKKDIIKVTAFYGASKNQMAWLAVSDSTIKEDGRANNNSVGDLDDFRQGFVQVQHTRFIGVKSKLTSTVFYNRLDGNWDLNLESVWAGPGKLNYQLSSNFAGGFMNYNYSNKTVRVNVGFNGSYYERHHSASWYPTVTSLLYKNTGFKNDLGGYVKVASDFGKVTMYVDLQERMTTFRYVGDVSIPNKRWVFFNPKAGLVYSKSNNLNYYFSVGQSHREPTRTNMFGGEDNLIVFVPVKYETVVDYELGLNFGKDKLKVQTNLYYMDFKNEITLLGALGSNGLPLMGNVSKSYRSGIELDLEYKLNKFVSIVNTTNYSYNRIVDNGVEFQPLYTPDLVINQGIKFSYKRFVLIPTAKYNSEAYINFDNTLTTPSFMIYGLNVGYQYKKVSLMVTGVNLTSENYYTSGYAVGDVPYYFANAPASLFVTLKIKI